MIGCEPSESVCWMMRGLASIGASRIDVCSRRSLDFVGLAPSQAPPRPYRRPLGSPCPCDAASATAFGRACAGLVATEITGWRSSSGIFVVWNDDCIDRASGACDAGLDVVTIDYGEVIAHGRPGIVRHDPRVIEASSWHRNGAALLKVEDLHVS
jgi:hypothetical protein